MNGRIYDPVLGQFMQPDNFIQTPEDYIGYDRYSYCRGNPFKFTDPSGESMVPKWGSERLESSALDNDNGPYDVIDAMYAEMMEAMSIGTGCGHWRGSPMDEDWDLSSNEMLTEKAWGYTRSGAWKDSSPESDKGSGAGNGGGKDSDSGDGTKEAKDKPTPYKQYLLEKDEDGNYELPDDYTLANGSDKKSYYKPETGDYDATFHVDPGCYITGRIDGVTTGYSEGYTDHMVFKIPDYVDVLILSGGYVQLQGSKILDIAKTRRSVSGYRFGWLTREQLDAGWDILFTFYP